MAEALGLAASVAGLVSLGIQVTSGIATYLDAVESRQDELASVKRQNDALAASLNIIKTAAASSRSAQNHHGQAITTSIQSCETELRAVEVLLAALANCDTTDTWRQRLRSKKKKLSYVFDRPKVQQVVKRLHTANQILQLTLTGITMEMADSSIEKLITIETSSRAIIPLADIRDRVVTIDQLQESDRATQGVVEHSHDSLQLTLRFQSEKLEKMEKILESLQPQGVLTNRSVKNMAHRVAGKPAALRELCDNIYAPEQAPFQQGTYQQAPYQRAPPGLSPYHLPDSASLPVHGRRFTSATEQICICPRSHRSKTHKMMQLGHLHLSEEQESRGHWPGCPLSRNQSTRKNHRTVGFKYTGLARLLSSVVGASFTMTSGAGGFSIGANLTYYPTADTKSDPAFLIMNLIDCFPYNVTEDETGALFMNACIKKLEKLFNENKAYPTAVSSKDESLMHFATKRISLLDNNGDSPYRRFFPQLITTLLQYGVPAISYNTQGASPLFQFYTKREPNEITKEVIKILVLANPEGDPAVSKPSAVYNHGNSSWTSNNTLLYNVSYGFAEACDCGPLSMAVIRDDTNEVARILGRFPASLLEIDIYKQTPLHLAAAKPGILSLLVQAADIDTLDRVDEAGISALEVAMIRSGDRCIHGTSNKRCRRCGCTECVDILLKAGCSVRMYALDQYDDGLILQDILESASELAKRLYVCEMQVRRFYSHMDHSESDSENSHIGGIAYSCGNDSIQGNNHEAEQWGWVYGEIYDIQKADLFYRYGFRPDPSIFFNLGLRLYEFSPYYSVSTAYICWLVKHGADLFSRRSTVPPPCDNDSERGLLGAHYAFFIAGERKSKLALTVDKEDLDALVTFNELEEDLDGLVTFNELSTTVMRRNLTDGCICHCSAGGCSPFLWMMKALVPQSWDWTKKCSLSDIKKYMELYYSRRGTELTLRTYEAAIRYATFQALGLTHTCCNSKTLVDGVPRPRVAADDVAMVNEEQASLLELHEELVTEFTEKAHEYLKIESFPEFWGKSWLGRIEDKLDKLNRCDLSDAERRGAEDIGVRWCEPPTADETEAENPYEWRSLEWFYFELDLICPD